MKTKFEQKNADFSDKAHLAALDSTYSGFFEGVEFNVESTSLYKDIKYQKQDGEMAIDRIFKFNSIDFSAPINITVQERFRRKRYADFRDITITEFNNESGKVSELHKMHAMYFVYGYYDEIRNQILEAIIIPSNLLWTAIALDKIKYTRQSNKKNQSFICLKIDDLINTGLAVYHKKA